MEKGILTLNKTQNSFLCLVPCERKANANIMQHAVKNKVYKKILLISAFMLPNPQGVSHQMGQREHVLQC